MYEVEPRIVGKALVVSGARPTTLQAVSGDARDAIDQTLGAPCCCQSRDRLRRSAPPQVVERHEAEDRAERLSAHTRERTASPATSHCQSERFPGTPESLLDKPSHHACELRGSGSHCRELAPLDLYRGPIATAKRLQQ